MLHPKLTGTEVSFQSATLPSVSAAFEGMDHLAQESDIATVASAKLYLQSMGVKEVSGVDTLRGA